jgi:hypothetical protein
VILQFSNDLIALHKSRLITRGQRVTLQRITTQLFTGWWIWKSIRSKTYTVEALVFPYRRDGRFLSIAFFIWRAYIYYIYIYMYMHYAYIYMWVYGSCTISPTAYGAKIKMKLLHIYIRTACFHLKNNIIIPSQNFYIRVLRSRGVYTMTLPYPYAKTREAKPVLAGNSDTCCFCIHHNTYIWLFT